MKKFLFVLLGVFAVAGAFAAGDNTPTSKSYVDSVVAQKQDKISANINMPAGYTRLAYLESTGTQWIDTLVTLGVDFEIYLDAVVSGRADHILFAGGLDVNRYNASVLASGINGVFENGGIEFGGDNNRFYIGISPFWVMHYNGVKKVLVRGYSPSGTLRVFSGTVGRLYNLKIYSGPLLQFNGIPARRENDYVVGMYDTVTGQFFTNSGTGEFIAGPVIIGNQVLTNTGTVGKIGTKDIYDANDEYAAQQNALVDAATMNAGVQNAIDSEFQCIEWLDPNDHTSDCLLLQLGGITQVPAGYTQLEYIESTGTQWIDTGVIPTVNTKTRVKFLTTGWCGGFGLFGARKDPYRFNATTFNGGSQIGFGMTNNSWPVNRMPCQLNSIYDCTMSNGYVKVNDTEYLETPVSESEWSPDVGTFKLASLNGAGTVVSNIDASRGVRWYVVQLWESNVLIRDFIPARHNSDYKIGMYDTVTNTFFTNNGTGEFIAGPPVGGAGVYLPTGE